MRRSTIRDVAKHADVSIATISNFLNDNKPIAPETSERIRRAIDELQFIPNSGARVTRGARNHAIAFLVPDSANPFLTSVARGIEDVAVDAGNVVIVCNTDDNSEREAHYARALSEMRVQGAVAMAMHQGSTHLDRLATSGAAIVVLGARDDRFPSVEFDNEAAGHLAGEHLAGRGRGRIAFLGGPGAELAIAARMAGVLRALDEAGIASTELQRIDATGNDTEARIAAAARLLTLDPPVDAVVCANDLLALAMESVALRAGRRVPADLAILGFDDIAEGETAAVPLTTVRQPGYEMGTAAARLVLAQASGKAVDQPPTFQPALVIREST